MPLITRQPSLVTCNGAAPPRARKIAFLALAAWAAATSSGGEPYPIGSTTAPSAAIGPVRQDFPWSNDVEILYSISNCPPRSADLYAVRIEVSLGGVTNLVVTGAPATNTPADWAISGRVEAVAGGETSSSFGAATVRILASETPAGPWREVRAEVDQATGAFALPAGALDGHFFRAEVETRAMLE